MNNSENDVSWALKLLEREPDHEPNLLSKYFHELYCGFLGTAVPLAGNMIYKRPLWAGIQNIVLFGAIGVAVGLGLKRREADILSTRDAKLRHYITLHPEDFPPPDNKKFADVFMPWIPLR